MSLFVIIPTLQRNPFLKQFCLEDMYSCSSDYLWYPYYPEYHSYCYQNVISRDNTGLSPADNIHWLGCIIAVFRRMAFREGGAVHCSQSHDVTFLGAINQGCQH